MADSKYHHKAPDDERGSVRESERHEESLCTIGTTEAQSREDSESNYETDYISDSSDGVDELTRIRKLAVRYPLRQFPVSTRHPEEGSLRPPSAQIPKARKDLVSLDRLKTTVQDFVDEVDEFASSNLVDFINSLIDTSEPTAFPSIRKPQAKSTPLDRVNPFEELFHGIEDGTKAMVLQGEILGGMEGRLDDMQPIVHKYFHAGYQPPPRPSLEEARAIIAEEVKRMRHASQELDLVNRRLVEGRVEERGLVGDIACSMHIGPWTEALETLYLPAIPQELLGQPGSTANRCSTSSVKSTSTSSSRAPFKSRHRSSSAVANEFLPPRRASVTSSTSIIGLAITTPAPIIDPAITTIPVPLTRPIARTFSKKISSHARNLDQGPFFHQRD